MRLAIAIYMYFRDHAPPHFHAIYGLFEAEVEIATGGILKGEASDAGSTARAEWSREYQRELAQNWDVARAHQPLRPIPPLE